MIDINMSSFLPLAKYFPGCLVLCCVLDVAAKLATLPLLAEAFLMFVILYARHDLFTSLRHIAQALHSFFRNAHVFHMKRTSHALRSQTSKHVQLYLNGTSILNISKMVNYPPSMMARLIVENVALPPPLPFSATVPSTNLSLEMTLESSPGKDCKNDHPNNVNKNTNSSNDGAGSIGSSSHRKFITEALRDPERTLGRAVTYIFPEYSMTESKCAYKKCKFAIITVKYLIFL